MSDKVYNKLNTSNNASTETVPHLVTRPLKMSLSDDFWVCCLIVTQQNGPRAYRSSVSYPLNPLRLTE
jgi:hypothetical protein